VFVNSMSDLFQDAVPEEFVRQVLDVMAATPHHTYQVLTKRPGKMATTLRRLQPKPLPNVWLGTSVEDQRWANIRIPRLIETPAAIRFLSCEPLLGPVKLDRWIRAIDWVIVGGESGPGARPMHPAWARRLRDECLGMKVACFFKQWGAWAPDEEGYRPLIVDTEGREYPAPLMRRVGKGRAGRVLDGRTWDQMPAVTQAGVMVDRAIF
jgi:protein gp37